MKFSFGCLSAVLVPVIAIANEIEQQSVPTSTTAIISDKKLKSSKENFHSPPSPFSKVQETIAYKNLLHRATVRNEPKKIQNSMSVADDVNANADADVDVDVDMKVNTMEAAGTTMAVSAAAAAVTTAAASDANAYSYAGADANANADADADGRDRKGHHYVVGAL